MDEKANLSELVTLPHSAQLLFLQILDISCLSQGQAVTASDREIANRSKLAKQSITDAKRILKNRGFIDFKQTPKGTIYRVQRALPYIGQAIGQEVGRALPALASSSDLAYSQSNKSTKEEELPPPPPPPPPASAYAIAQGLAKLAERITALEERLGEGRKSALPAKAAERASALGEADADEKAISAPDELDAVIAQWDKHEFARLDFTCVSELAVLLERYGKDELIAAMKDAARSNQATGRYSAVSVEFFKEIVARRNNPNYWREKHGKREEPKPGRKRGVKADERNECNDRDSAGRGYRAPRRTGTEEWRDGAGRESSSRICSGVDSVA